MQDQEYKIRVVQRRKEWTSHYGTFQDYALQLDGWANGWVSLSQKPETKPPAVGDVLYGHIETKRVPSRTPGGEDMVFNKFKKGDTRDAPSTQSSASKPSGTADNAYIIQMLEELTGRKEKPANPTGRDTILDDIDASEPFNLDDLPDEFRDLGI